ncbi:hypothetical protein M413DRAFT_447625 [Hebeloma cylindrosporum]|uniref:Uncharacterized protein n=1 Tax=Hebeloma cylindrosporum TaxID=76867 RepID=A0A0C3BPV3_HEBCY|nr:hypothetical protein M413DRAFT_447625 [Hebeloma cylindrosporum h7]
MSTQLEAGDASDGIVTSDATISLGCRRPHENSVLRPPPPAVVKEAEKEGGSLGDRRSLTLAMHMDGAER